MKTSYMGEFGYELIGVIPYAYWLHTQGRLKATESAQDTKVFYYFSPQHTELTGRRKSLGINNFPLRTPHRQQLDKSQWLPPPYKAIYENERFIFDKPICIVTNKYNLQWRLTTPVNYINIPTLHKIFNELKDDYQIIYSRITGTEVIKDHRELIDLNEHQGIKEKFPEVITMQELAQTNPDLSFNRLQVLIFANAQKYITTQGGYSILGSFFGGTNIIFAEQGQELSHQSYSWYHEISGTKVIHSPTYKNLLEHLHD